MAEFLEERLDGGIQYGSSWTDDYAVNIITTSGGQEYRGLVHIFPVRKFDVTFMMDNVNMWQNLVSVYHRAHGKYAGFRARCLDEYTSNINGTTPPSSVDQAMGLISTGVYQLRKYYGTDKAASTIGYAYRNIKKPVTGTVSVAIQGNTLASTAWSVSTATGVVTLTTNRVSATFTGISKAAQAVILTSNTGAISAGDYIHISGVSGMTQINGLRALVVAVSVNVSITVNINSAGFSTWTAGGIAQTHPQAGESVTAGFEFDFPVRFNSTLPIGQNVPIYRDISSIELVELLNP